jgi:hypothetical protein
MLAALGTTFCKAIGFVQPCEITLRTTWTGEGDTSVSWRVNGRVYSRLNDPPSLLGRPGRPSARTTI